MSTTDTTIIHAVPARRSILHPDVPNEPGPFADWRGQASTEEPASVPLASSTSLRRPSRRTALRRHLRAALVGTLLAIVAITGLSSYAAQGIADARQNALCQAHISCK